MIGMHPSGFHKGLAKLTSPRRLIKEECSSSKWEGIVDGKRRLAEKKKRKGKAVIQEAVSNGTIDRIALLPELVS